MLGAFLLALPLAGAGEEPVFGPPMTALAAGALARSDLVVIGRVETVGRVVRVGVRVATVRVERALTGEAPSRITVTVGGPRPTNDREAPSRPYLEADPERSYAFFLSRRGDGGAWNLVTAIAADGALGEEKVAALEKHIGLARIPDPGSRARATLTFLLAAQGAKGTWTRVHAARELNYLAGVYPDAFDARAREALAHAARKARVPAQRTWLVRVLQRLKETPPPPDPSASAPPDVTRLRDALTRAENDEARVALLTRVLEQGGARALAVVFLVLPEQAAPVRRDVVDRLAEGGWSGAVNAVRGLYAQESDPTVQRAVVTAVGRLGGASEVPWLAARTHSLRVQREALFALARIGTPEARAVLERFREEARRSDHGDKDVTALVDYLLGPAFAEVEGGRMPR